MPLETDPAVVSAASGLIGALVGGAISGGLTLLLEKLRWSREDKSRFHAPRLDAYSAFSAASAEILAFVGGMRRLEGVDMPELARFRIQLAEDMVKWAGLRQRVAFLGQTELQIVATKIGELIKAAARVDSPDRDEIVGRGMRLIASFVELGRKEWADPLNPISMKTLAAIPTSPPISRVD